MARVGALLHSTVLVVEVKQSFHYRPFEKFRVIGVVGVRFFCLVGWWGRLWWLKWIFLGKQKGENLEVIKLIKKYTWKKKLRNWKFKVNMGVSKNNGIPKSSILIGFSIINHPFLGISLFLETSTSKWWMVSYRSKFNTTKWSKSCDWWSWWSELEVDDTVDGSEIR